MKKTLTYLIISLILVSCTKKEDDSFIQICGSNCTEIVGKIMTDNGTVPVSNLNLTVKWSYVPFGGGGTIRTKATTITDSQGNFSLKFFIRDEELEKGGFEIIYQVDHNEYLDDYSSDIPIYQIARDTTITINHNILKKAFLNLSLLNLDQMQQGDYFSTTFLYPEPAGFSQNYGGQYWGWNNEMGQNHTLEIAGNQPIELRISRTKNGVRSTEIRNISFDAGTTTDYSIDFNN